MELPQWLPILTCHQTGHLNPGLVSGETGKTAVVACVAARGVRAVLLPGETALENGSAARGD